MSQVRRNEEVGYSATGQAYTREVPREGQYSVVR
jgi:hypothetical protein